MELRRRRLSARKVFVSLYVLAFAVYLVIGLQPAEATQYEVAAELDIPSINLTVDVTRLSLNENKLDTPDTIVGSYSRTENKTLLIGHSSTVFDNLKNVKLKDQVNYDGQSYRVVGIHKMEKAEVKMDDLLQRADKDTLVIMTCAGQLLDGGDATHRLVLTAVVNE